MKLNQKVLLTAALAGLFTVPAFAKKAPTKTDEKKCTDEAGYTIPCDDKSNMKSGNGCGANGCSATTSQKTEKTDATTTTTTTTPAKK